MVAHYCTSRACRITGGLGLSIVYGFVRQNDGFPRVESTLGVGTSIEMWFPQSSEGVVRSVTASFEVPIPGKGEMILIVDDEPGVLRTLERVLVSSGYRAICAPNGPRAIELWEEYGPEVSLVIVDMVMPGMSGEEVLRRMNEIAAPPAVLIVSGHLGGLLHDANHTAVPTRILAKPWRRDELLRAVQALLDSAT